MPEHGARAHSHALGAALERDGGDRHEAAAARAEAEQVLGTLGAARE
jgi:hypothetical protein